MRCPILPRSSFSCSFRGRAALPGPPRRRRLVSFSYRTAELSCGRVAGASHVGGFSSGEYELTPVCPTRSKNMKKWNIAAMAAVVTIVAGTFGATYAADKLKVGFIYVGPVGDLGWSYQHDLGRKAMEKALGDKVESTFLENVPEGADAERSIEQLARTGHKLIFTTSFGFMDATLKVANKYPDVMVEHATGFKRAKNMSTYAARFYEGRYIQGQIAAKMSKSGIIGYIVSFPIPEVISNINATMLGAQSINPNIKVK